MFIYPKDPDFKNYFNQTLFSLSWKSPIYSKNSLSYYKTKIIDDGYKIKDESLIFLWEGAPAVLFLGATLEKNSKKDLLYFETPCLFIENKTILTKGVKKVFLKEFDQILDKINGKFLVRDFLVGGNISSLSRYLLLNGATVQARFNSCIDLEQNEKIIKTKIRKLYKANINWGLKNIDHQFISEKNITWDLMNMFRKLHIRESGRETRSENSWKKQMEMIKAKEAFMIFGYINDELIACGLFMYNESNCYYGVSVSNRKLFDKPINHSLLWNAILYAKNIHCKWFDFGEQVYKNHPKEVPTKKELGISNFKAGFGGETRVFLDLELKC